MSQIPTFFVGRYLTTCLITPIAISANGTTTQGTSVSLLGQLDEIEIDIPNETENIVPMDLRQNNNVIVGEDATFTLTEILKYQGVNILAQAAGFSDYVNITLTRGAQTFSFLGVVAGYTEGLHRGKSTGRLVVKQTATYGQANPTYQ